MMPGTNEALKPVERNKTFVPKILAQLRQSDKPTSKPDITDSWRSFWENSDFTLIFPEIARNWLVDSIPTEVSRKRVFRECLRGFLDSDRASLGKRVQGTKVFTVDGQVKNNATITLTQKSEMDQLIRANFGFIMLMGLNLKDRSEFLEIINDAYKEKSSERKRTFLNSLDTIIQTSTPTPT